MTVYVRIDRYRVTPAKRRAFIAAEKTWAREQLARKGCIRFDVFEDMDDAGAATPAGTFEPADDGRRSIVLAGSMNAGDTIGVTVEPAGGSPAPTGEPLFVVETA